MKTIQLNLYPFSELSELAKSKVITDQFDINVCHAWWDFIYADAKTVGLIITGFDIDRDSYCNGKFTEDAIKCASLIMANHGEQTDTYQIAESFREQYDKVVEEWPLEDNGYWEDVEGLDDALGAAEGNFLKALRFSYLKLLTRCYDELTGKEAITETIMSNGYFFTIDGELATDLELLAI